MNERNVEALHHCIVVALGHVGVSFVDAQPYRYIAEKLAAHGCLGPASVVLTDHDRAVLATEPYIDDTRIERIAAGVYLDGEKSESQKDHPNASTGPVLNSPPDRETP